MDGRAELPSLFTSLAAAVLLADAITLSHTPWQLIRSPAAIVLLFSQACGLGLSFLSRAEAATIRRYLQPLSQINLDGFGGGTIFAPWLMFVVACVWAGLRINRGLHPPLGLARGVVLTTATIILGATSRKWAPPILTSHVASLLWLLSIAHFLGCAADCRAHAHGEWSFSLYVHRLLTALAYVMPATIPIVLTASSLMLAATSLSRLAGIDPGNLRWIVRWGALHAPFWFVHVETRRSFSRMLGKAGIDYYTVRPKRSSNPNHRRQTVGV